MVTKERQKAYILISTVHGRRWGIAKRVKMKQDAVFLLYKDGIRRAL